VKHFKYKPCGRLSDSEQSSNNTLLAKWYNQFSQIILGDCTTDVGFMEKMNIFFYMKLSNSLMATSHNQFKAQKFVNMHVKLVDQ
jgi:hypothetical protein